MDMIQCSGEIAQYRKLELSSLKLLYLKDRSWCLPLSQGSTYEFIITPSSPVMIER